ncbi:MAG: GIY-YIG nuclease family protein [Psychrosphaera sp.]|nr:GIY-YIG nuclease family protein [Psychrosphaera sp.]
MTTNKSQWFVYVLRCADNSLYTGITTDVERRVKEHNSKTKSAAKYTRARQPVKMVYHEQSDGRSGASRRECAIKKLTKAKKEALIDQSQ